MAALVPYVLPAVLGGALNSARSGGSKGDRRKNFLTGALGTGAALYGAGKMGFHPFGGGGGAPVPGGAGGSGFNPFSFMSQMAGGQQRIEPEAQMRPLYDFDPEYLPPAQYQ